VEASSQPGTVVDGSSQSTAGRGFIAEASTSVAVQVPPSASPAGEIIQEPVQGAEVHMSTWIPPHVVPLHPLLLQVSTMGAGQLTEEGGVHPQ